MSPARAGLPAALLALMFLATAAPAQTPLTNPLDIFKQKRLSPADSAARTVTRAAPPPASMGLPVRALRVPGVQASLGDSARTVLARLGVAATAQAADGDHLYTATVTFFGQPTSARLHFMDGRLAQAEFEVQAPLREWSTFVMDELRRQGYRRECRTLDERQSDCTWNGRTEVWLQADAARLAARVGVPSALMVPAPAGSPGDGSGGIEAAEAGPPSSASAALTPAPVLPETLYLDRTTRSGRPAAVVEKAASPAFPQAARAAGVQGIVHVIALVDEQGAVQSASVLQSIPELDAEAVGTVSRYQFAPLLVDGRPVRYRVDVPVRFLLH